MSSSEPSSSRFLRAVALVCGRPFASLTWALWLAFALGYLGTQAWLFDLFANFRLQYLVLFGISAIALSVARWRKTAAVALIGVAVTTATMGPYFLDRAAITPATAHLRVLTFNVLNRNERLPDVAAFLAASAADLIVLQEADLEHLDVIADRLNAYPHRAMTPNVKFGVAIFSRWPLEIEHLRVPGNVTRITQARVRWREQSITLFGAHLNWPLSARSSANRAKELQLLAAAASRTSGPIIVVGDFNLTPWSRYFERFTSQSGLKDCALGQGIVGTWPAQFPPLKIRIDHCFVSSHFRVNRLALGPKLGSDHLPVIAEVSLAASQ